MTRTKNPNPDIDAASMLYSAMRLCASFAFSITSLTRLVSGKDGDSNSSAEDQRLLYEYDERNSDI